MQAQLENIRDGNFYFPKYSASLSKSSIDQIGKLESVRKITLNVISQS